MIKTERYTYEGPGGPFEGTISWDDESRDPRPGVLIAHAFGGEGDFEARKAQELAELGYFGFAIDLYGKGRRAKSPDEARRLMATLNDDRPLLARRMLAALESLKSFQLVEVDRTAAIGFCFGGKSVLDLARSGTKLSGVVSFHGVYDPPAGSEKPISTPVLVLHGWNDPLAPPDATVALAAELTSKGADWQIQAFGHTGHAFTNPRAQAPDSGMQYSEAADRRAWLAMRNFLEEVFNRTG